MSIEVQKERCTGCHLCEMVCSIFHLQIINPSKSAIRILKDDLETGIHTPMVCRQCKKMKCIENEDADEALEKKRFIWNWQRAESCPFNGLSVFEKTAYHCDLCGGVPQCILVCTNGAITVKRSDGRSLGNIVSDKSA
jgi:Fe-S-cluster-containing hydrogenase component 2